MHVCEQRLIINAWKRCLLRCSLRRIIGTTHIANVPYPQWKFEQPPLI